MKKNEMHWIGVAPEEYARTKAAPATQTVPAFFALAAELDEVPEKLVIRITGRSQYKLFVNGSSVIFGPLRSRAEQAVVDEPDIAPYLAKGLNRLLVQTMSYPSKAEDAKYEGPCNCYPDDGGPGIAVSGRIGGTDLSLTENWCAVIDDSMDFNAHMICLAGSSHMPDLGRRAQLLAALREGFPAAPRAVDLEKESANFNGERLGRRFEERPIPPLYRRERDYADCWPCDEKGSAAAGKAPVIESADRTGRPVEAGDADQAGKAMADTAGKVLSIEAEPHTTLHFVLDAGELTTAYPRFALSGGRGSRVRITYAECFLTGMDGWHAVKGMRDDRTGFLDGLYDELKAGGGEDVYEPFRFRTFRFIRVDVTAEDEPLKLKVLPFIETAYPLVNDKRPDFSEESGAGGLAPAQKEKLYDVALRTLQLCMHDTYEDCPYYEQLMYACDTRLEILFTYSASSDTRLPEYAIDLFASSLLPEGLTQARYPSHKLQVITGFALYFVMMLEDYINATGNAEKMAKYIPTAERIIESFLASRDESGLIAARGYERDYWEYWDWTKEWDGKSGTPNAIIDCGVSTLENLVFVYALQSFCRILPRYHRESLAEAYEEKAQGILKLVREKCRNEEKGLFREAPGYEEYSQHSQIFAVLTGLVSGEEAADLMEKVIADRSLVQCSFVQRFYLFRALEKAGMYDRTAGLWADWQHMIDLHCSTFPETPYSPRSECHAWSALPLYEFAKV